jgi:hypothetical protein
LEFCLRVLPDLDGMVGADVCLIKIVYEADESTMVNLLADERLVRRPRDHVTKDKQKHSEAETYQTIAIRKGYPEATA